MIKFSTENRYPDTGNCQRELKAVIPMRETPNKKIKTAIPMLGGGFENENIVFTIKISTTCQHFVIRDHAVSRLLQSHDIVRLQ